MQTDTRKPIIISGEAINEAELQNFIADIEKLTGSVVRVFPQWVVTSDSPSVEIALEALFGAVTSKHTLGVTLTPKRKTLVKKEKVILTSDKPFHLNPAPHHEIKSWEVIVDGVSLEKITISEKNERLNKGLFQEGTELYHPKAGRNRITGAPGNGQGMTPVEDTR